MDCPSAQEQFSCRFCFNVKMYYTDSDDDTFNTKILDPVLNSSFGSFVFSLSKIPDQQGSWQGLVDTFMTHLLALLTRYHLSRLWCYDLTLHGFYVNAIKNISAVKNCHVRSSKYWRYKPDLLYVFYSWMLFYSFMGDEALSETDLGLLSPLVTTSLSGKPQHGQEILVWPRLTWTWGWWQAQHLRSTLSSLTLSLVHYRDTSMFVSLHYSMQYTFTPVI